MYSLYILFQLISLNSLAADLPKESLRLLFKYKDLIFVYMSFVLLKSANSMLLPLIKDGEVNIPF